MCPDCNRRHNEEPGPYLQFTNERYGEGVVAELDRLRRDVRKVTDEEMLLALEGLRAVG